MNVIRWDEERQLVLLEFGNNGALVQRFHCHRIESNQCLRIKCGMAVALDAVSPGAGMLSFRLDICLQMQSVIFSCFSPDRFAGSRRDKSFLCLDPEPDLSLHVSTQALVLSEPTVFLDALWIPHRRNNADMETLLGSEEAREAR